MRLPTKSEINELTVIDDVITIYCRAVYFG